MDKFFYVERKCYYLDNYSQDRQCADGGELPMIYRKRERAIQRAKNIIKYWTKCANYEVTIPNENNPAVHGDCLFAVRLQHKDRNMRCEVRVYLMEFEDED